METHDAPRRSIDERIEQRPIGDRVAAIEHRFRFAEGRCNRTRIEMIASNDNRRFDLAAPNEFIHGHAKLRAFAVA